MKNLSVWKWPLLAVFMLFCIFSKCYAWDADGHFIVAQDAYDKLTPVSKAECNRLILLLKNDPDVSGLPGNINNYNFVTVAAWMDDLRSIDRKYSTWHYIDLPIDHKLTLDDVKAYRDANSSNAYLTIVNNCVPTLKSSTASDAEKAKALGLLIHLVGDIHQPLHCAGSEKGGNGIQVTGVPGYDDKWPTRNLHSFWDGSYRYKVKGGEIGFIEGFPGRARDEIKPDSGPIKTISDSFDKLYPSKLKDAGQLDPAEWALESNSIAASFAYPPENAQSPYVITPDYAQKAGEIARARLVLAGSRLANLLNDIFK
jgi:hypothetical protein